MPASHQLPNKLHPSKCDQLSSIARSEMKGIGTRRHGAPPLHRVRPLDQGGRGGHRRHNSSGMSGPENQWRCAAPGRRRGRRGRRSGSRTRRRQIARSNLSTLRSSQSHPIVDLRRNQRRPCTVLMTPFSRRGLRIWCSRYRSNHHRISQTLSETLIFSLIINHTKTCKLILERESKRERESIRKTDGESEDCWS